MCVCLCVCVCVGGGGGGGGEWVIAFVGNWPFDQQVISISKYWAQIPFYDLSKVAIVDIWYD